MLRQAVLLSLQRALVGNVFPALRGMTVSWESGNIRILAYVDGDISEDNLESLRYVETEVIADFFPQHFVSLEVVRKDAPEIVKPLQAWVYLRREPSE